MTARLAVADINKGDQDEAGQEVLTVYYRNGSHYAIYRTPERVSIQYSDDPDEQAVQRKRLATLGPLRGEINGLIDGWRNLASPVIREGEEQQERKAAKQWWPGTPRAVRDASKVNRYDRRGADALLIALEGEDAAGSLLLLEQIKTDLIEERKSWARVLYVIYAGLTVAILTVLSAIVSSLLTASSCVPNSLWLALVAGSVGAFFSIAQAIRSRSVLTDLQMSGNIADAVLRILVGAISAVVLIALLLSKLVGIKLLGSDLAIDACLPNKPGCEVDIWNTKILIGGFIAGFLERLVPDLLQKASAAEAGPSQPLVAPARPVAPPAPAPVQPQPSPPQPEAPAPAQPAAQEPEPEHDEHGDDDACLAHAPVTDDEATPDQDLPPADGGVAKS